MPTEFETKTCAVCAGEVDETIEAVPRDVPGATINQRFCSDRHRQDYLDKIEHVEEETPRERVESELRDAGMNPDAFDEEHGNTR